MEYSLGFSSRILHKPWPDFGMPTYGEKSKYLLTSAAAALMLDTFDQTVFT